MVEQAACWAAQLATDDATQADRDACEAWCREDPSHRLALERMCCLDARFDRTDAIGREAIEAVLARRSRKRGWLGGVTLGLAVLVGGGWLAAQSPVVRAWFPDHETARGEQRTVTLADGSGLTLDTGTTLDFRRDDTRRIVTLFQGRILARVAKDKGRLFVVETRDGTATARGTAFIVRRDEDATTVTVLESRVRVCLPSGVAKDCADLSPGDRVRMRQDRLVHLRRVDPEATAVWADGWLAADDQPVVRVLLELNRYRKAPLHFDRQELAAIRVSGSFPLTDSDRALRGLLTATGLRVARTGKGEVWVRRAE
ncbi:iron dicitrate transport regulator FecR [Sphingomonas sp. Leaf357]|nr:iron dicitrate transport regulator FecR [Sphingomonas sp. Leaf357]